MCGVVGYYSHSPVKPGVLETMANSIRHRGPDAQGIMEEGKVGLGHRRLSIIDLSSSANQPMESPCKRFAIVFNGEIYNFKELKHKYQLETITSGDTEVILQLFAKKGPECVQELNGMFVFIIWDRIENKLFFFRDRLGKKPLFYFFKENNLYFSSELKALSSTLDGYDLTIDSTAVAEFLHLGYIPEPKTIYKEILKFPAAAWSVYDGKEFKINRYWELSNILSSPKLKDEEKATATIKDLLNTSVAYRLISDVPFGTFLSGGIDSSLVTAIAARQVTQKLNTFSIGFNDAKHDESQYARKVADY